MTQETINCLNCHHDFELRLHKKARWAAAGAAALVGSAATESLLGGIIIGAVAYSAATAYDEHRARTCPECKTVSFPAKSAAHQVASPEVAIPVHH